MAVRFKKYGLTYFRRSGASQEMSLEVQLDWALARAAELGVEVDVSHDDLRKMVQQGLTSYKSIRLDDSVSGAVMDRPGFTSLVADATRNKSISHVFAYRRDRLARPEDAFLMASRERGVRERGVTFVFSDKIAGPRTPGVADPGDEFSMWYDYFLSGEFLKTHAERVINGQTKAAKNGHRTGGRPPYGFVRILVDSNGNEIEELADGRRVRQKGCHVAIKPKDEHKVSVWLWILQSYVSGMGAKRIAAALNAIGEPSPDAGRIRTDHGQKHLVSGKWGHNSVLDLIRNSAIAGLQQYGKRSEGQHRRLGCSGPRPLEDCDRTEDNKLRLINNNSSVVIEAKSAANSSGGSKFDPLEWRTVQDIVEKRGASQKGIPRAKDFSKYPLSLRVIDMTDGCGWPIYGIEKQGRRLYACGLYMSTAGAECEYNTIDAEALLGMCMAHVRDCIDRFGARNKLRERLFEIAKQATRADDSAEQQLSELEVQKKVLERAVEVAQRNFSRAETELEFSGAKRELAELGDQLAGVRASISRVKQRQAKADTANDDVESAMTLLSRLDCLLTDPTARLELRKFFELSNLRIGLNFTGAMKGTQKAIRQLCGGVIAMGDGSLPVRIHGRRRVEDGHPLAQPDAHGNTAAIPCLTKSGAPSGEPAVDQLHSCRPEGVSLTKVSRGDWI